MIKCKCSNKHDKCVCCLFSRNIKRIPHFLRNVDVRLFKDSLSNFPLFIIIFVSIKSNGSTKAQMAMQCEIIVARLEFKVVPLGKETPEHTHRMKV